MATGNKSHKGFVIFDVLLGLIGLAIWVLVAMLTWRQVSTPRLAFAVDGFELANKASGYHLSGKITNKNYLQIPGRKMGIPVVLEDKLLPFFGSFFYRNNSWHFRLSKNIAGSTKTNDSAVLYPRCYVGEAKLLNMAEPGTEFEAKELTGKELIFQNRDAGQIELKLSVSEDEEGKLFAHINRLQTVPVNLSELNKSFDVKVIDKVIYTLSHKDPATIIVLPQLNQHTGREIVMRMERTGFSEVRVSAGKGPAWTLNSKQNSFVYNGWHYQLNGLPSNGWIFWNICFIMLLLVFGIYHFIQLFGRDNASVVNLVETRMVRAGLVYFIFTLLSVLYIN